jgi:TPR repeat protein
MIMRAALKLALVISALPLAASAQTMRNTPQLAPQAPNTLQTGLMPLFQPQKIPASKGPDKPGADLAFGAYQRGYFRTAFQEAMKRIEKNRNDAAAMTLVAEIYRDGSGVKRDLNAALHWYKLAADRGDRNALFAVALAALRGEGIAQDKTSAKDGFEKAAAKGHPGAWYNLGVLVLENEIQDFRLAADYFRRAADGGSPDGAYSLAVLLKEGKGVERNLKESAKWMTRAADENIAAAIVELAIMTFNGNGVDKDEAGAVKLFRKAASRNNPIAMNRLARLLVAGRGVEKNVVEGMKWHLLARAVGLNDEWLDQTLGTLTPSQRQQAEESVRQWVGP